MVKILLKAQADVNAVATKRLGEAALQDAVARGFMEVLDLLLEAKADANMRDQTNGYSALHSLFASFDLKERADFLQIVHQMPHFTRQILQAGFNVNLQGKVEIFFASVLFIRHFRDLPEIHPFLLRQDAQYCLRQHKRVTLRLGDC